MSEIQAATPVAPVVAEAKPHDRDSVIAEETPQTAVDTPAEPATATEVAAVEPVTAEIPAIAPVTEEVPVIAETQAPVETEPATTTVETTEAAPAATEEATTPAPEEPVVPIHSGYLQQRGPRPLRLWQKRYFAFRAEPYALNDLNLVYKKNVNRGLRFIRASERAAAADKGNDELFADIATATVDGKGLLYYYKSDKDTKAPLGIINLRQLSSSPAVEKGLRSHAFSVKTTSRDYILAASSSKDVQGWLASLEAEASDLPDVTSNEAFQSALEALKEKSASTKPAPAAAAVAATAAATAETVEAAANPEATRAGLTDNEIFSGSEAEPEAETPAAVPATEAPTVSKRKSYFSAFDNFLKSRSATSTPKAEETPATEAEAAAEETPAAPEVTEGEAAREAEVAPAAAEEEAAAAPAEGEKSIVAAEGEKIAAATTSAADQAKAKAKELGTFISKFLPKRPAHEAETPAEAEATAAETPEAEAAAEPEVAAPAPTEETTAAAEPEVPTAEEPTSDAAKSPESPARSSSPIQRTLTKLLRPLHFGKPAEAATPVAADEAPAAEAEAATEETPAAAEIADGEATREAETASAAVEEETPAAEPEAPAVAKPNSFLKRLGTLSRNIRHPSATASPTAATEPETEASAPVEEAAAAEAAPAEPEAVVEATPAAPASLKSGFLQKQSQFVKGYDRRFVSLTDQGKVVYGKSDKETRNLKSFPISKLTKVTKVEDGKRPFTFDIATAGRTYRFVADSDEERTSWIDALTAYQTTLPEPESKVESAPATSDDAPTLPPVTTDALTPTVEEDAAVATPEAVTEPAAVPDVVVPTTESGAIIAEVKAEEVPVAAAPKVE
ncbi:hypothetical protein IWQ60_001772 [Tieghemiomyces parasiticus]|uniref:PH domain-containing protein n=1 Tax=Tieghemiomyces parasiticus TaxID=78921 RepID=A0A9W8ADK1_9FUNG|nr:hypothetical protein IWQ60_001772 [Tieghemiomyces parasiticus]